uniref:LOW QUALITY PROTEIN: protein FAM71B-like n=1 Tax=Phascolarctos cinereus TaxID=38626 RepID=A0A6P5JPT8_PHACI|nr:LOW QUALITY PROTEIN: protein FAM71B-like [Phascolarctos cinereus]
MRDTAEATKASANGDRQEHHCGEPGACGDRGGDYHRHAITAGSGGGGERGGRTIEDCGTYFPWWGAYRLLPLKFVKISVHDQLCPPCNAREDLYYYWEKVIDLLQPPIEGSSSTHAIPVGDGVEVAFFAAEEKSAWRLRLGRASLAHKAPRRTCFPITIPSKGWQCVSLASRTSGPSIAIAAATSKGLPARKTMAGAPAGMGAATAGSQGPGISVALAGTTTGQVTETTSASSGSLMLAGAAGTSPDSVSRASAGISSLTLSGHMSTASAGARSMAVGGLGKCNPLGPEHPFLLNLHSEGYMSERKGSQRVTMASPKVAKIRMSLRRHARHQEG